MHWVDVSILIVIALSMLTGLIRGFVKELIALFVWIIAIWLAFHYNPSVGSILKPYIHNETFRKAASFLLIMLCVLLAGGFINVLFSFILKRSGLSGTDRFLGMGFGLVRGVFIIALIMVVARLTSLPHEQYAHESKLYSQFDPAVNWLSQYVPGVIKQVKVFDEEHHVTDSYQEQKKQEQHEKTAKLVGNGTSFTFDE